MRRGDWLYLIFPCCVKADVQVQIEGSNQFGHCYNIIQMSFANQYIQKYGDRAVQAYKRSLKHADLHPPDSPKLNAQQKTIKRSSSGMRNRSNHSKSCKSIKNGQKHKQTSSRSVLQNPHCKPSNKASSGFGHTFNSIHLNLQGMGQQQKKKLVIEGINTPKNGTPSKVLIVGNKRESRPAGISTNVNVYVQSIDKSKTKSKETTPSRDFHLQQSRQNKPHKKTKRFGEVDLIRNVIQLVQEEQSQKNSKCLRVIKQKLCQLQQMANRKQQKMVKLDHKFQKMKEVMRREWEEEGSITVDRERELNQRVVQLEEQMSKYRQKEKTLLKIVESLSGKNGNRWKQDSQEQPPESGSEQDDA